jgi:hypothetical protein
LKKLKEEPGNARTLNNDSTKNKLTSNKLRLHQKDLAILGIEASNS